MKTTKSVQINGVSIPAGTNLEFSCEGLCTYKGVEISQEALMNLVNDMEATPEALDMPDSLRLRLPFTSRFYDKVCQLGVATVDQPEEYGRNTQWREVVVKVPEDIKGQKALCNILTELGLDGKEICLHFPALAVNAGLGTPEEVRAMSYDYGEAQNGMVHVNDITIIPIYN
jgi:hypothetical protein